MTRPAYKHNRILSELQFALMAFFKSTKSGEVLNSENLFAISALTRLGPDLAVFVPDRRKELAEAKVITLIPEIVVEILSPNERPGRIARKLSQYFNAGVKEVWIIDPEARTADLWNGAAAPYRELAETDQLTSPLLPGFAVTLAELFA